MPIIDASECELWPLVRVREHDLSEGILRLVMVRGKAMRIGVYCRSVGDEKVKQKKNRKGEDLRYLGKWGSRFI